MPVELTSAKRRLLQRLKWTGPATAAEIAAGLELTRVAVRQHLHRLEVKGFVDRVEQRPSGRGRPACRWELNERSLKLFPDRHTELARELLELVATELSEAGLHHILKARSKRQLADYRRRLPKGDVTLKERVQALAWQRTADGYMARFGEEEGQRYILAQHHCPIWDAARGCGALCRNELEMFRSALGEGVEVERIAHVLEGDRCCAYRIRQRGKT